MTNTLVTVALRDGTIREFRFSIEQPGIWSAAPFLAAVEIEDGVAKIRNGTGEGWDIVRLPLDTIASITESQQLAASPLFAGF